MPDVHGDGDRGEVEAPGLGEGEVVLDPALDARRERAARAAGLVSTPFHGKPCIPTLESRGILPIMHS